MEIACDESGYEGEKLIGTTTTVFAHGSVRLDPGVAAECMGELRDRIRSPATQYKANHILRDKHRPVLRWFLGPSGPVIGYGHVFLIDKAHYVRTRLAEVLGIVHSGEVLDGDTHSGGIHSGDIHDLEGANNLLRGRDPILDLRPFGPSAAGRAEAFRTHLRTGPTLALSAIDPLIPAIVAAVAYWSGGQQPVTIVHDRQTMLPAGRVEAIRRLSPLLADLTCVDSGTDPRVQIADILAGAVRAIASDDLAGHGDPALTALLPPYVDTASIWASAAWA